MLLDKAPAKVDCDLGRRRGDMIYNCTYLDNYMCDPSRPGKANRAECSPTK